MTTKELIIAAKHILKSTQELLKDYEENDHDDPDMLNTINAQLACSQYIISTVRDDDDEPVTIEKMKNETEWELTEIQQNAIVFKNNKSKVAVFKDTAIFWIDNIEIKLKSIGHLRQLMTALIKHIQ